MAAPPTTTVALLSGGLDSATACALALEAGHRVIGLCFDYGQRHRRELEAASGLARAFGLAEHHTVAVNLAAWGGSSLTDSQLALPTGGVVEGAIPSTYVPGRNTVFIAIGLSLAEARGAQRLVLGVNGSPLMQMSVFGPDGDLLEAKGPLRVVSLGAQKRSPVEEA